MPRRRSLEDLTRKELKELEEPITADSEGEVMLVEDLDDSELPQDEFVPPAYQKDPNEGNPKGGARGTDTSSVVAHTTTGEKCL